MFQAKKLAALSAAGVLAAVTLSACGLQTDGTYKGSDDGVDYTLVLNTDDSSAKLSANNDGDTVDLTGSLNTDEKKIAWEDADTNYSNDVLDKLNDLWSDSAIGSDPANTFVGKTSNYDLDGKDLTLNLDGDEISLERE